MRRLNLGRFLLLVAAFWVAGAVVLRYTFTHHAPLWTAPIFVVCLVGSIGTSVIAVSVAAERGLLSFTWLTDFFTEPAE